MAVNDGEQVFAIKGLQTYLFPLLFYMFDSNKYINGCEVLAIMLMEKSMDTMGVISRLVGTLP